MVCSGVRIKSVSVYFCIGMSRLEGTLLAIVMTFLEVCKRVDSWCCVGSLVFLVRSKGFILADFGNGNWILSR